MTKGLIIVITGDGKGKTTSALGLALRSVGQGNKVLMIQFLKSSKSYGEIKSSPRLSPDFEIIQVGKDCVYPEDSEKRYRCEACDFLCHINPENPDKQDRQAAEKGFQLAGEKVKANAYNMIILDEINYAINYGLIPLDAVLNLLREKPSQMHLVLTGRSAHPAIASMADLVTEMLEIKHPLQKGIRSIKGIDL